ncbi:MAG TPA: PrsW family glutamic-type intramembrane protease [bacterium]|nr:PrsW family glutamic-type intramembrane protease [bacterium]
MVPVLAILAAFIPAILWLWFFHSRDRYEREPKALIIKLFLWGVLAMPWAAGFNELFQRILGPTIERAGESGMIPLAVSLLVVMVVNLALNEEALKYLVTANSVKGDPNFNEPVDGMIYMSTAALGFAAAETVFYVIRGFVGVAREETIGAAFAFAFGNVAVLRALTGTIGHVTYSGIVGYSLAQYMILKRPGRLVPLGIALATLLHASWNLTWWFQGIFAPDVRTWWIINVSWYFALAMVILAVGIGVYLLLLRRALAASPFRAKQLTAAPTPPAAAESPPAT